MSDEQEREEAPDTEPEDDAPASTPFDNPFFLPAILWAFALWCAWDIVTDAKAYQENPMFNQGGLVISVLLAI